MQNWNRTRVGGQQINGVYRKVQNLQWFSARRKIKIHLRKYAVLLYTKNSIINTAIQKRAKLRFWQQNETYSVLTFTGEKCSLVSCSNVTSDLQPELFTSFCFILSILFSHMPSWLWVFIDIILCNVQLKNWLKIAKTLSRSYAWSAKFVKGLISWLNISGNIVACRSTVR